jgi:metallophosphoesterase (TIGR00282 family)
MRIAFFGDIVGRAGRDAIADHLPRLRADLRLDFVIANAENAAGGYGLTEAIAKDLFGHGCDALTLGNHSWDQREALTYIEREQRLIRPCNYPPSSPAPGRGAQLFDLPSGQRVLVINVLGRLFMDSLDDPFAAVEREVASAPLGEVADAVIIDVHAEATSEKQAMGCHFDGRASLVVGSHTHVPTADTRIMPGGTAFQTDAGMCGDYDSVIGMKKEISVKKFITRLPTERNAPAEGTPTLSGVFVETNARTGLAIRMEPIRIGGVLNEAVPKA